MATLQRTFSSPSGGWVDAFRTLADEAGEFFRAIASPNRLIDDVEQMRALQMDANRIEATDPARAAVLRSRAARIGLR